MIRKCVFLIGRFRLAQSLSPRMENETGGEHVHYYVKIKNN